MNNQKSKTWVDHWYEKVQVAQRAVTKAEQSLPTALDPADQTRAFRELKAKQHQLKQALRSPV